MYGYQFKQKRRQSWYYINKSILESDDESKKEREWKVCHDAMYRMFSKATLRNRNLLIILEKNEDVE